MLRPEKMSKVSVAGSKRVMRDTIETLHDLNLVDMSDYDGSYEGFENGNPLEGGEESSEKLVQIRSIENILDIEEDDFDTSGVSFTEEEIESRLKDVLERVNSLEDQRDGIKDELREVRDQRKQLEPFVNLGIDIELLRGYETIDIAVGESKRPGSIREELSNSQAVEEFEVFGDGVVVVAAKLVEDSDTALSDILVGANFSAIEVPKAEGSPDSLLQELKTRENKLESDLENIEERKEALKKEVGEFVLAAEEELSVKAQKEELPLQFATTDNSFVAEGWIPTDQYGDLQTAIESELGDHVDVTELKQARYGDNGHGDGEDNESPPVKQKIPSIAGPFEVLTKAVNVPKYNEIDPTFILFLTFPLFFGFMIGDIGYGIFYAAIGGYLFTKVESSGLNSLGGVALWAGIFTIIFGVFYGEFFGLHLAQLFGVDHMPKPIGIMSKGLHTTQWALLWLTVSVLVGVVHLNIGFMIGFVNELSHGFVDAFTENLSWLIAMDGLFLWIFANTPPGQGTAPGFIVGEKNVFNNPKTVELGYTGLPETVGFIGVALFFVGVVLVAYGEGVQGAVETPTYTLVHVVSYTRIGAILLAKGGMAFAFNLMAFGAYEHDGHVSFLIGKSAEAVKHGEVLFPGMMHSGIGGLIGGIIVLLLGHALVFALGITSAGLQAVRLEYVEFFGKFYEGGGRKYQPFGYQRKYTTED